MSWMIVWFKDGKRLEYLVPNSKESEEIVHQELSKI